MIRYALLALLRQRSDYGYALRRRYEAAMGDTCRLNVGQVYQTLASLKRAGLVAEVGGLERCNGHPPRRTFAITPKGEGMLHRWTRRTLPAPRPARDEFFVRLLLWTPERTGEFLEQLEERERQQRASLTRLVAQRDRSSSSDDNGLARRLGLEEAIRHTEAHIGWLASCRDQLKDELDESPSTVGPHDEVRQVG